MREIGRLRRREKYRNEIEQLARRTEPARWFMREQHVE